MLVYVRDTLQHVSYIVSMQQGTGDNLLAEDIEEGYVGYINYYADRFVGHYDDDCGFKPLDAGMYLCTEEEFRHVRQGNMKYIVEDLLAQFFGGDTLPHGVTYKIIDEELEE